MSFLSVVDLVGVRCWGISLRGTPSRILKLRLTRKNHASANGAGKPQASSHENVRKRRGSGVSLGVNLCRSLSTSKFNMQAGSENTNATCGGQGIERDELDLLQRVLQEPRHVELSTTVSANLSQKPLDRALWQAKDELPGAGDGGEEAYFHAQFARTRRTWIWLKNISAALREGKDWAKHRVEHMPATTFSELLRSLDPVTVVSPNLDPFDGLFISPSRAKNTTLATGSDNWGVRPIYRELFENVLRLVEERSKAGKELTVSDYEVLLRCAGAASDPTVAKGLWHKMESAGAHAERNGHTYDEFLKARFLTETLYTQYDLKRFCLRPIELGAAKKTVQRRLRPHVLRKLRLWRYKQLQAQIRSGQDHRRPWLAESLTRMLSRVGPIRRLWFKIMIDQHELDEALLCDAMVAFARTGSIHFFQEHILKRIWRITVRRRRATDEVSIKGGTMQYARGSPLYPTTKLLEAVVDSYCINAEVASAFKVVDFISQRYDVLIPEHVWFKLFEYTYIQSSVTVSREWAIGGWSERTMDGAAVKLVWDTMTAAPYNVQPGFRQYELLVNRLLALGDIETAMEHMLELEPFYRGLQTGLEESFYNYMQAQELRIPVLTNTLPLDGSGLHSQAQIRSSSFDAHDHKSSPRKMQSWKFANARKEYVFSVFSSWCSRLLKNLRPTGGIDDDVAVRLVPHMIEVFRPMLPPRVRYRIATGEVELHSAAPVRRMRWVSQMVSDPALDTADVRPSTADPDAESKWAKRLHHGFSRAEKERQASGRTRRVMKPLTRAMDSRGFEDDDRWDEEAIERQFT